MFILLARQQGLDVVYLGLADKDGAVRPWLPALVAETALSVRHRSWVCRFPVRSPAAWRRLPKLIADDELLRKLDLDAEHPYPVKAEDLKHVVAYVEATPPALRGGWRWSSRGWPAITN